MFEDRNLAHFIDLAELRRTLLAASKEVTKRGSQSAPQVQHQRCLVRVAGLGEAVEPILGHAKVPPRLGCWSATHHLTGTEGTGKRDLTHRMPLERGPIVIWHVNDADRRSQSAEQLEQALAIRLAVFVEEQGVNLALEIDGRDDAARHLLALRAGEPVGTCACVGSTAAGSPIERVAVLPRARGAKIGQALVEAALAAVRAAGAQAAAPCADQRPGLLCPARLRRIRAGVRRGRHPHVAMSCRSAVTREASATGCRDPLRVVQGIGIERRGAPAGRLRSTVSPGALP